MATFVNALNMLAWCYFGRISTQSYAMIADCMYELNWYELPTYLQKNILYIIANAQRKIQYEGFGIIILQLETICKVKII